MQDRKNTGRRLAKNTTLMYFRMVVILIINFYASRVILQELGVDDFGIYNVVASIIIMFASLRFLIASSTQRFLNFEMGRNNDEKLSLVFNMSIYINILIAFIFFVIVEVVGLWFLHYKINIDPIRLNAAMIVFQCSVIGSVVSIFTTSFDAAIIAHERMDFLALVSVIESVLKLLAAMVLPLFVADKLMCYGFLLMCISILIFLISYVYCKRMFIECKLAKKWDKQLFLEMIGFASWNFLGKSAAALTQSGINMILNVFGGPVVNAARGIAFQLNSATNQFVNNVNVVFDPFFIKTYASREYDKFYIAFDFISKVLYYVQLCIVIPFYILSDEILRLWLGQVPENSVDFLRLILIWSLIRAPHSPIDKLFKAVGNIKYYQILEGIILALPLPTSYFLLKVGCGYSTVFISMIIFEIINLVVIVILAKRQCRFPIVRFLSNVVIPIILLSIPFIIGISVFTPIEETTQKIILVFIVEILTSSCFMFLLNGFEKEQLKSIIKK